MHFALSTRFLLFSRAPLPSFRAGMNFIFSGFSHEQHFSEEEVSLAPWQEQIPKLLSSYSSMLSATVLFGEAGKEFIDFLFSLLALPLGSVIKLLSPSTMPGSIGNLYQSVENLSKTYLLANRDKSTLLQPKMFLSDLTSPLLLGTQPSAETTYYLCNNCKQKIATKRNNLCPKCMVVMANEVTVVLPSMFDSASTGAGNEEESVGGFVKGVITYMITDNLEVTPLSAVSSFILIERLSVKKDLQLEEKVVSIGMKEGLALLKASLDSPTVLTDVFCSRIKKTNTKSSAFTN